MASSVNGTLEGFGREGAVVFRLVRLAGLMTTLAGGALPLAAQDRGKESPATGIPANAWPAPGLCRVWLRDVPPSQQAAATDCSTAIRNRPANGVLLFGEVPAALRATSGMAGPTGRSSLPRERAIVPVNSAAPSRRALEPTSARTSTVGATGAPVRVPDPQATKVPDKQPEPEHL